MRLLVIIQRNQLGGILNAQDFKHLPVQVGQVVQLRRTLRQLHHRLILHNLLRHGGSVGVGHRDYSDEIVVAFLGPGRAILGFVVVGLGGVVADNVPQQDELLLHGVVNAGLNSRHHLKSPLQNSQRRTNRAVGRHVANLQISSASEATTFFDDGTKQRVQDLRRLLVRERHDVVFDRTRRNVYVPELSRCNRRVVSFDTKSASFETTRKV